MYALNCSLRERPTSSVWDLVSGLLYQFHSQGIEEGEEPPPSGEQALVAANEFELALEPGVLSPPEKFSAYFENRRDAERAQRAIEPVLQHLNPIYEVAEVEEKDYAELWKEGFKPIAVPPFWLIRAPWHTPEDVAPYTAATKVEHELIIEPGMAFGTGSHETTKACLELMALAVQQGKLAANAHALDFGCGSGILAIGLKALGIGNVYAVDIDPLAIQGTKQNAERNGVEVSVSLEIPLEIQNTPKLDGIVANILKNTLLDFAASFHTWLKPKGFLILSGLLEEQEQVITKAYGDLGFRISKRILNNNWVSLWLVKN
jgi:ribosomal protein L11 methyltransferase